MVAELDNTLIFPAKHFVTTEEKTICFKSIEQELQEYLPTLENELYRQRIGQRTARDLEMIDQIGYCSGIENYSVHFDGRSSGQQPYCLFDFSQKIFFVLLMNHILPYRNCEVCMREIVLAKSINRFWIQITLCV